VTFDARQLFERFARAISDRDVVTIRGLVHPDFVGFYPQSGERFGSDLFVTQLEQYPTGPREPVSDVPPVRVVSDDGRWVITPAYTVVPLVEPSKYTAVTSAVYPDGSEWHIVIMVELREGLIYRSDSYFAPVLPAPLGDSMPSRRG